MPDKIKLREINAENVQSNKYGYEWEYPVAFEGSPADCMVYAEKRGYRWIGKRNWLFGGYYVAENGDCLTPA